MDKNGAIDWLKSIGYWSLFEEHFIEASSSSSRTAATALNYNLNQQFEPETRTICDIIETYESPSVLEIGTNWGITAVFMQKAARKAGGSMQCVDTVNQVVEGNGLSDLEVVTTNEFIKLVNKTLKEVEWDFYEKGSDAFFEELRKNQSPQRYDVIFVDGDHSYVQSIKDIENSIEFLSENGVIFLHDLKQRTQGLPEHRNVLRAYKEIDPSKFVKFRTSKTANRLGMIYRNGDSPPEAVERIINRVL